MVPTNSSTRSISCEHGDEGEAFRSSTPCSGGGLLTPEDFAKYTVRWDEPVLCDYRGYTVVSAPPSSSGGTTLCEILQTIEGYPLSKLGFASVPGTHVIMEAERRDSAERNTDLGDPAFNKKRSEERREGQECVCKFRS